MGKSLVSCFLRHSVHYVNYINPYWQIYHRLSSLDILYLLLDLILSSVYITVQLVGKESGILHYSNILDLNARRLNYFKNITIFVATQYWFKFLEISF